ncbi:tubulin nucleotide-binding domain-like protein [Neurospora hispaniola]|uniref:Tubulin nucleotide-binding domain-like protein n=1 Tax=Neurospora hispaniola TaxID=588809 RepID=A0AAJ0MT81_9PEZI|nr:tubulin nucleotide-binding domain-like protein [Neurospora hispaniola]
MHEIITLQLGQQSNYLATHFWNTQESYFTYSEDQEPAINHDIHWRPGIGADGTETYMPRTVIYDLKGGFGSMAKTNALYNDLEEGQTPQALWNGPTVLQKQPAIPQSAYQQSLDAGLEPPPLTTDTVRYWSDFNRVFYHPRSVVQLNEYELNSSIMPFERYATGEDLFASLDKEHDLLDRDLRPFIEEADQMQGIQVMTGLDDAWGGFAAKYLERIRDEYGKTAMFVWGSEQESAIRVGGLSREKRLLRLANKARTMTEVYKYASVVVPFTVPATLPGSVVLDAGSQWHNTALSAAAIESVTLPSRLRDPANRDTMGTLADTLNAMGKQNVASLGMSFAPEPTEEEDVVMEGTQDFRQRQLLNQKSSRHAAVMAKENPEGVFLDINFTPTDQLDYVRRGGGGGDDDRPRVFSQVLTSRGYEVDEQAQEAKEAEEDERFRRRSSYETVMRSYHTPLRFPLLDSFPQIFRDDSGEPLKRGGAINVTSSLSTDASVHKRLKSLRTTVGRSIGLEDREQLGNELAEMADEYHEGWSSGSDDGDDD